ncbi:MAG TPA: tetratricopeptide repeat protein [Phaeodactylibacter sp.]|nr:tetratricopeptide repeat protein [Phaeodactylibacter sp.]
MNKLRISLLAFAFLSLFAGSALAQCETWNDHPRKDELEDAHVLYRGVVKGKTVDDLANLNEEEFNLAYKNWKAVYEAAPAADGQRATHFSDGRKLLKAKYKRTSDAEEKKELAQKITDLYDQQIECYENEAFLLGRKGFDMFYMPEFGYRQETYDVMKEAVEKGGNDTEYILLEPMAQVLVYFFKSDKIPQKEAQETYTTLEAIAEHNIENNERYGEYYDAALGRMNAQFKEVEDDVFDCDYFKKKLIPQYEESPEDLEVVKYVYVKLRQQGCDTTQTVMQELKTQYETLAKAVNDSLEIVRRQNNPCYDASQLQQEGKYDEALARYKECLDSDRTKDDEAKAQVYYSIASIYLYRKNSPSSAVSNARKAAKLDKDWGRPYLIIGDGYAKMGRNCDDWTSRLAILAAMEKYRYAKSIDSSVAGDADKRLNQYYSAMPEQQEGFMRGVKEGQKVKVGCGIGETVTVRFKSS